MSTARTALRDLSAPIRPLKKLKADEVIAAWRSTHPCSSAPTPEWAGSLGMFIGTESLHVLTLMRRFVATDGVKYLSVNAECFWLIGDIASYQPFDKKVARQPFQVWTLAVDRTSKTALLVCDDGNGNVLATQNYDYASFPLDSIKFYVTREPGKDTIMLPSEY
jgi:hypothetical protein